MFSNGFPKEWSTLRKLMWLYRCVLAAAVSYTTATGASPLTLANAIAKSIKSLTQYGECVQDGTPTPSVPVDIMCNNGALKWDRVNQQIYSDGTPETLTVSGKNIFDKSNLTRIYAFIPATGNDWYGVNTGYSVRIPCRPNTTYTVRYNGNSTQAVLSFGSTNNDDVPVGTSTVIITQAIRQNNPTINTPITITTGATDKWLIVAYNVAEPQNTDMANNLQIEIGATATAYEPYTSQSATAENLFAVGDAKDEQNIITGEVTRRVGVKVLDGTETWYGTGGSPTTVLSNCYTLLDKLGDGSATSRLVYCTHYQGSDTLPSADSREGYALLGNSNISTPGYQYGYYLGIGATTTYPNIEDFKAFLAAQYAAGTPVIVLYPLDTSTTESVTGQSLSTVQGTNIASVRSNVDPVTLSVEYAATT